MRGQESMESTRSVVGMEEWTARGDNLTIPVADAKAHRHAGTHNFISPVAMRLGETPVLIPNTMVKP